RIFTYSDIEKKLSDLFIFGRVFISDRKLQFIIATRYSFIIHRCAQLSPPGFLRPDPFVVIHAFNPKPFAGDATWVVGFAKAWHPVVKSLWMSRLLLSGVNDLPRATLLRRGNHALNPFRQWTLGRALLSGRA